MADSRDQMMIPRRRRTKQPPALCEAARNYRRARHAETPTNPSTTWGQKRPRTSRRPALHPDSSSNGCGGARDWASLGGDGPAGLVAELVLANDVADYVRFRAVCRPWRLCSPDPRGAAGGLDGRFLPRQWIMLDNAHSGPRRRRRRFFNVSTGECIRTDLPELAEHTLLALSPEGLLLLIHEPTLVVRLLNPLTRQLTELPPVTALLTPEVELYRRSGVALRDIILMSGVGLADDDDASTAVAVSFRRPNVTATAKPGDEHWTVVERSCRYIHSALPFAGRFYCAVGSGVMALSSSTSASDQGAPPAPRLLTAVQGSTPLNFNMMSGSLHLVDNGGELILVHRMLREDTHAAEYRETRAGKYKIERPSQHRMEYEVFRVDFDAGDLVPVKDLGGRAVFMGRRRAVSVLPAAAAAAAGAFAFPCVSANTLYLGFDCYEKTIDNQIDGYNVADGSSEPCRYHSSSDVEHPCSLVNCLSYCIQGTGQHLA